MSMQNFFGPVGQVAGRDITGAGARPRSIRDLSTHELDHWIGVRHTELRKLGRGLDGLTPTTALVAVMWLAFLHVSDAVLPSDVVALLSFLSMVGAGIWIWRRVAFAAHREAEIMRSLNALQAERAQRVD